MEGLFELCNLARKSNNIALIRDFATELPCSPGNTTRHVNGNRGPEIYKAAPQHGLADMVESMLGYLLVEIVR